MSGENTRSKKSKKVKSHAKSDDETGKSMSLKVIASKTKKQFNALAAITNVRIYGLPHWKGYNTGKRRKNSDSYLGIDRRKTAGTGLVIDVNNSDQNEKSFMEDNFDEIDNGVKKTTNNYRTAHNTLLFQYFIDLSKTKNNENIDLNYIVTLIKGGADLNSADKYGQTILHETARAWETGVAIFLIDHGADVNVKDYLGRTPLHVAAAVDSHEMVDILIERGADIKAETDIELQTPVHFAARTDSCKSLKALINKKAEYKLIRDYKERTPLHVAAELDRSETARMLLELDSPAPAGVTDYCGQSAVVVMIKKMPPVAKLALDQFHTTDRANRRQYYHLDHLEPRKPGIKPLGYPQSALQVIVNNQQIDLITHKAVERLLEVKWKNFARFRGIWQIVKTVIFIGVWTAICLSKEHESRHIYDLKTEFWRIMLWIVAVFMTAWQIVEEIVEYRTSQKSFSKWKNWRESEIEIDLKFCHKRWPEERAYLEQEIRRLDGDDEENNLSDVSSSSTTTTTLTSKQQQEGEHEKNEKYDDKKTDYFNPFIKCFSISYFHDPWNIFDWLCYLLLIISMITHIVDIVQHTTAISRWHIRIMSIAIIMIWIRILKIARAYSVGPFVVMIFKMLSDIAKFVFVYFVFYMPFCFAFWVIFGGEKNVEKDINFSIENGTQESVSGMKTFDRILFTLFRITLVDDYDFDGMIKIDLFMTYVLLGSWLALSSIIMLNLIIALMSDTFQRVYDNAQANAAMQKAITILNIEEGLTKNRREKFRQFIHTSCSPQVCFYDDDDVDDDQNNLKKVTIQIKDQLNNIESSLKEYEDDHNADNSNNNNSQQTFNQTGGGGGGGGGSISRPFSQKRMEKEFGNLKAEISEIKNTQNQLLEGLTKCTELLMQSLNPNYDKKRIIKKVVEPITEIASEDDNNIASSSAFDWKELNISRQEQLLRIKNTFGDSSHGRGGGAGNVIISDITSTDDTLA